MIANKYIPLAGAAIFALFFASCDNRKDYFIDVNQKPALTVLKDGEALANASFSDSVKIGNPYVLQYYIEDEENVKLIATQIQGINQVAISENSVTFSGLNEGLSRVVLTTNDSFGASAEFTLNLTVFRNLSPAVRFSVVKIGLSSPYEVEVDASASFDKDSRFGGNIVLYEYTLVNYSFQSSLSKVRYIFGSAGEKKISVRVKDNSGTWSELVSKYIVLEQ